MAWVLVIVLEDRVVGGGGFLSGHPTLITLEHEICLDQSYLGSSGDASRLCHPDLLHTVEQNSEDAFGGITEVTDVTPVCYSLSAEIRENGASVIGELHDPCGDGAARALGLEHFDNDGVDDCWFHVGSSIVY